MITHTFTANAVLNGKHTHIAGELENCADICTALLRAEEFFRQIPVHITLKDLHLKPHQPPQRARLHSLITEEESASS